VSASITKVLGDSERAQRGNEMLVQF